MSRELFEADGFIAETILYDRRCAPGATPKEIDHWWFQRGMPVKQVKEGKTFTRRGDHWVSQSVGTSSTKNRKP